MKGIIVSVYFFFEDGTILIMRRENHAYAIEVLPVFGPDKPYANPEFRYFGKRKAKAIGHSCYPAVFNTKSFKFPFAKNGRVSIRFMKMNPIIAANESQVGECSEIIIIHVVDYPWIRSIQMGIIFIEAQNFYFTFIIIYRKADFAFNLFGPFSNT